MWAVREGQSRQADFAPWALGTLVRCLNHLSYLCGPKSLPNSFYRSILSVLIWVQTVCKCYQKTTNVAASRKIVKVKLALKAPRKNASENVVC